MSELKKEERDTFDGGFAVVDRERLIEEETRVVTPWYKHFINSIIAPSKMMQENLLHEPPKGNSIAVVGFILFIILITFMQHINPEIRQMVYDVLRNKDVAEDMIAQQYIVTLVVGAISSFVALFAIAFVQTLVLQILKVIAKDRCKFASLYTVMLLGLFISLVVQTADYFAANLIGVNYMVFNLASLFDRTTLMANNTLMTILSFFSLERIVCMIYLIMGYSMVTHKSKKKATIIVSLLEVIILGFSLIFA